MNNQNEMVKGLTNFFKIQLPRVQNLEILELNRILGGMETEIHSFVCIYKENGKSVNLKFVVRIYHSDGGSGSVNREFDALMKLRSIGYPVPKVYYKDGTGKHLGKPFIIIEFVEGVLMGEKMLEYMEKKDLISLKTLIDQFNDLYIRLHMINWFSLVENTEKLLKEPKKHLQEFVDVYDSQIRKLEFSSLIPIMGWLKRELPTITISKEYLSLVHGDFHPNNILLREDEPFVFDWHGIRVRDFRVDIGYTLILMEIYATKDLRDAILESYEKKREKIPNLYFFEALAAMIRVYEYLEAISGKIGMMEEREKLLKENEDAIRKTYAILIDRTGEEFLSLKEKLSQ